MRPRTMMRQAVLDARVADTNERVAAMTRRLVWAAWAAIVVNALVGIMAAVVTLKG